MVWYRLGHPRRPPSVGVFVVAKKLGKQMLILDARRVNQHFRRPWHCALPTAASWAGLQLPVGSTYHMAQTDGNNAFCHILAPPGMSAYFILPSVSTQLLLQEGVEVPDHLLHLTRCVTATSGPGYGSFLGSSFLSEDGGKLCSVSWLLCGRFARGSLPGTCDVSGFNLLRGPC